MELYNLAADQGEADAQYSLALLYETGTGVKQNMDEAIRLYTLSYENGNLMAKIKLMELDIQSENETTP